MYTDRRIQNEGTLFHEDTLTTFDRYRFERAAQDAKREITYKNCRTYRYDSPGALARV